MKDKTQHPDPEMVTKEGREYALLGWEELNATVEDDKEGESGQQSKKKKDKK